MDQARGRARAKAEGGKAGKNGRSSSLGPIDEARAKVRAEKEEADNMFAQAVAKTDQFDDFVVGRASPGKLSKAKLAKFSAVDIPPPALSGDALTAAFTPKQPKSRRVKKTVSSGTLPTVESALSQSKSDIRF
mmetsp:Transcript_30815/g.47568  ORF Transcript_30815/g.47568 Transcript_30815/m.47568 type:complete len:133 (+) Transcript_30815:135-533(+)